MADWRQVWQSILDALRAPPSDEAGTENAEVAALSHDLAAAADPEVAQRFEQLSTRRHEREIERLGQMGHQQRQRMWVIVKCGATSCLVVTVCLIALGGGLHLVMRAGDGLEISVPSWAVTAGSYVANVLTTGATVAVSAGVMSFVRRRRARVGGEPRTDSDCGTR